MTGIRFWVAAAMLTAVCGGCGSATTTPTSVSVTPAAPPPLKALLEGLAQSGEIGSGQQAFMDQFAALEKSDAAKAEAIKADFDKLMSSTNPAETKKLAAELAAKL
jgi:hypothetical protein